MMNVIQGRGPDPWGGLAELAVYVAFAGAIIYGIRWIYRKLGGKKVSRKV
jgi:hypothetical protein